MLNPKETELIYRYQVNKRFGNTSFESFVKYVIEDNMLDSRKTNDHWLPYWKYAGCANPLDYYIKEIYNFNNQEKCILCLK